MRALDRPEGIRTPIATLGEWLLVRLATGLVERPRRDSNPCPYLDRVRCWTTTPRGHFDGRSRSRTHTCWLWRPVAYQLAMRPYDGDRTCTGLGSLCGGAHISSATPSSVGTGGIEPRSCRSTACHASFYTTSPILKVPVGLAPTYFALPRRRLAA